MEANNNYSTIIDSNNNLIFSKSPELYTYAINSTMNTTYDENSTAITLDDRYLPNIASEEFEVDNKTQPTCKSKKNLSPSRFSKRRAKSKISRKSRHRRQQHK